MDSFSRFVIIITFCFSIDILLLITYTTYYSYRIDILSDVIKDDFLNVSATREIDRFYFYPIDRNCFDFETSMKFMSLYCVDNNPRYPALFYDTYYAHNGGFLFKFPTYDYDLCGYYIKGPDYQAQIHKIYIPPLNRYLILFYLLVLVLQYACLRYAYWVHENNYLKLLRISTMGCSFDDHPHERSYLLP